MARELPPSLTVRPVVRQGTLEETRYRKASDGLPYSHEGRADLWLVETRDGRRMTLTVPRRGAAWTREGGTTWLTNSPTEGGTMKKRKSAKRHSKAAAKKRRHTKRPPPAGFASWAAYMASIRPNRPHSSRSRTVAHKKRRAKRSHVGIVKTRRRSTRRRSNPPAFSVSGLISRATQGAIGGGVIVATEMGTRLLRSRVFGMPAGTLSAGAVELGSGIAAGVLGEKFVGSHIASMIIAGAFASVIRTTVKQSTSPLVQEALADRPRNCVIRNGRAFRAVNGYVPGRLNGYVPGAAAAVTGAAFDVAMGN